MNATVHYVNELPENQRIQRCIHCDCVIRDLDNTLFVKEKRWSFPEGKVYFVPEAGNMLRITVTAPRNITINSCK